MCAKIKNRMKLNIELNHIELICVDKTFSDILTFYGQFAGCRVTTDAVGRETRVLAFVLGEYLVDRENGYSILIFEIDDLRRAQQL